MNKEHHYQTQAKQAALAGLSHYRWRDPRMHLGEESDAENEDSDILVIGFDGSSEVMRESSPIESEVTCIVQGMLTDLTYHPLSSSSPGGFHAESNNEAIPPESYRSWASPSILQGAHHLVFNQPIMVSMDQSKTTSTEKMLAMDLLSRHRVSGAELDSYARSPPPFCHPGTREALRMRIDAWIKDSNREANLLWLHGPAGVGKTAVAQTIGQDCKDQRLASATFFFSRPNERNDPTTVIPTLVYQLLTTYPAYEDHIIRILLDDRTILEKSLGVQFSNLIVEPLLTILSRAKTSGMTILIILDGLDESTPHHAKLPILWMITSRPEWQITSTFAKDDPPIQLQQEQLSISSPDAGRDVALYLGHEFERIRRKYEGDTFSSGTTWPTQLQLAAIKLLASGLFVFASTVIKFVDDDEAGDPVTQLNLCLEFLKGGKMMNGGDPLDAMHTLYSGIFKNIPSATFPRTMRILHFCLFTGSSLSMRSAANFLSIRQPEFYASLRRLHSVLNIPSPQLSPWLSIQVLHTSFADFVKRIALSGIDGVSKNVIDADISSCGKQWIRKWRDTRDLIKGDKDTKAFMPWYYEDSFKDVIRFSMGLLNTHVLQNLSQSFDLLCSVDFSDLQASYGEPRLPLMRLYPATITSLLTQLSSWQASDSYSAGHKLLRTKPDCPTDRELFRECAELIGYRGMEAGNVSRINPTPGTHWEYKLISLNTGMSPLCIFWSIREAFLDPRPMYFLLGYETNTCLVIAYRSRMFILQYLSESFSVIRAAYASSFHHDSSDTWPSEDDMTLLTSAVQEDTAGVQTENSLIRSIMTFVANPVYADPKHRLELIVGYLRTHQHERPSRLDEFIHQRYPTPILPHNVHATSRVLASLQTHSVHHDRQILARDLAQFLGITEHEAEDILLLTNLTVSALPFPMRTVAEVALTKLKITEDEDEVWTDVALRHIHWSKLRLDALKRRGIELFDNCWLAFLRVLELGRGQRLLSELREFPFSSLDSLCPRMSGRVLDTFCSFVSTLWKLQAESHLGDIIRVRATCETDNALLEKWKDNGFDHLIGKKSPSYDLDKVCEVQFKPLSSTQRSDSEMELQGVETRIVFLLGYGTPSADPAYTKWDVQELATIFENEMKLENVAALHESGESTARDLAKAGQETMRSLRAMLMKERPGASSRATLHSEPSISEPSNVIPNFKLAQKHLQIIQHGLLSLYHMTAISPPDPLLTGEVLKLQSFPVNSGIFGDIWPGLWLGEERVALKNIEVYGLTTGPADTIVHLRETIALWSRLHSRNVSRPYGFIREGPEGNIYLVSPWAKNGNVSRYIQNNPGVDRMHLLRGAAEGLRYLHAEGIIHGYVSCANILVSASGDACINSYGLSHLSRPISSTNMLLNPRRIAPEILRGSDLTPASDVYSFGISALELLTGALPFAHLSGSHIREMKQSQKDMQPERPTIHGIVRRWLTDELWALLQECWSYDPVSRPTMKMVVTRLGRM
ncbi:hypothetical protein NP233_g5541 [Leucocoprinus birnbaumii]|uniref:Protein kinase domain-containing protein n=1 Tax=Leucocoprinus birnbaumii TaxID=56174 RepID=A0AAD5YWC9_9AGAR|nr:hypothetical protein NP233_g5541 [Leucocoprinus birnbaumii]